MIDCISRICRLMQAQAHQKHFSTTEKYYLNHDAKQRDEEKLAQIMETRERWRRTNGLIDIRGRPEN